MYRVCVSFNLKMNVCNFRKSSKGETGHFHRKISYSNHKKPSSKNFQHPCSLWRWCKYFFLIFVFYCDWLLRLSGQASKYWEMEGQITENHMIFYCYIFSECLIILCLSIQTLGYEDNVLGVNEFHRLLFFLTSKKEYWFWDK